ncbi:hypothetical protein ACJRO7_035436 [Eucalyptus globulus]|uniref:Uncharacterized protein n=1 Tax=Eucalyptus globulus TaxID=34317 RepID=A0ABD3JGG1_EUCGL
MDLYPSKGCGCSPRTTTTAMSITDVDINALVHGADCLNMVMSCKFLTRVAYSDPTWPWHLPASFKTGVRRAYVDRPSALKQLKFVDPSVIYDCTRTPCNGILMDKNHVVLDQGSGLRTLKSDSSAGRWESIVDLNRHKAEVTCGPVLTLSDKLIGEGKGKVLASGGEDGTVRLWSLASRKQALKSIFYGHEKPVKFTSVARHRTSLLVSFSTDSEIRIWDADALPAIGSSCCVGMASVSGAPVNMKCHESLLYVAADSLVTIIDLRTIQRVSTAALPKKEKKKEATLWDVRKNQGQSKPVPIVELDGQSGPVAHLHMDPYKIVTGGPEDDYANVWEADTANQVNSLISGGLDEWSSTSGCSAIAMDGCCIVTASSGLQYGLVRLRDFTSAEHPDSQYLDEHTSKVWYPYSYSDDDDA